MKMYLKMLLVGMAVVGLNVPATALAQKSAGGVVGEARLHPGTWGSQSSSRSFARSRPMYRSTAPVIVRTEQAPSAVAQAPAEQRRFSYEPSRQAEAVTPCPPATTSTRPAPATAQRSGRAFSYEPSMSSDTGQPAVRSYSAPRMRSSRTPLYLLPKTDPRKYNAR
jgi:hypothetical protein